MKSSLVLLLFFSFCLPGNGFNASDKNANTFLIFVIDNGVHLSIGFPVDNNLFSWDSIINVRELGGDTVSFSHLAFGWGDKEFYTTTPSWDDLKAGVAIRALFWPTPSVMKVDGYTGLLESEFAKALTLDEEQFRIICGHVLSSFEMDKAGFPVKVAPGYGMFDAFYKAKGRYHLFRNSNTWVARGLRQAGIKTPFFTLTSGPVMRKLKRNY